MTYPKPIITWRTDPAGRGWWLFLPLPPSDNDRLKPGWSGRRGRRMRMVPTVALEDFKLVAIMGLRTFARVMGYEAIKRTVYLDLWVVLPNRRRDPSNCDKALCDVLQHAGLVVNDRLLLPRYQGVGYDAERPGVTVLLPRGGA